jgi:hypothetical protein
MSCFSIYILECTGSSYVRLATSLKLSCFNQCESMPCIAILISTSKNPCSFLLWLILSLQQN